MLEKNLNIDWPGMHKNAVEIMSKWNFIEFFDLKLKITNWINYKI